ncbi:MAG: ATP-dependent Clp protease adaptor ClpS [Spirochaetia bacterium]|nr:ATP-dependent Clp protease adaptor ClpS [Spirochaetia bacterium]
MAFRKEQFETGVKTNIKKPSLYKVIMHNDDYTTMQFVVELLTDIFRKRKEEAMQIMLNIHRKGYGVAGIYPREIAETKIDLAHVKAKERGYPLKCTLEKEN